MTISLVTTEEERRDIRNLDLSQEPDFLGLDYIMEKAQVRAGRRIK